MDRTELSSPPPDMKKPLHEAQRRRLPAEWEDQDGVLIAWPHAGTDWGPHIEEVEPVFVEIAKTISLFERCLIVVSSEEHRPADLLSKAGAVMERVRFHAAPIDDTWARDFGPITVEKGGQLLLLDFVFNGWGGKFAARRDNAVTRTLWQRGAFGKTRIEPVDFVMEGGSIESDGRGTLLTTSRCLLNPNRNAGRSREEIERMLAPLLGAGRFLWLENGRLEGDDTDSHVDTLARFAPCDTIVHVACPEATDPHFADLQAMAAELKAFRTREGRPYRLLPLPWPSPRFDEEGGRLPATYANFLVINGAVLVPTYGDPNDAEALNAIGQAFFGRRMIGIPCLPLIQQHGSLHCVTMQLPRGAFP